MSQPFNSPRQALNWLKKRNRIESIDGMTIYHHQPYRPIRMMSWDSEDPAPTPAKEPPEDQLDDQAQDMLERYGHVFKKPKVRPMSGMLYGSIVTNSIWRGTVDSVAVEMPNGWHSGPAPEPILGFVSSPVIIDEFGEVDMENPDLIHRPIGGPDVSPPVRAISPESAVRDLTDEINQFNESLARPETRTTGFGSQPAVSSADEIARANREDIVQFKRLLDTMAG